MIKLRWTVFIYAMLKASQFIGVKLWLELRSVSFWTPDYDY